MRNIWKIFTTDIRRISNNVVAVVIIMGLSILPALYAWFNIFSNWDPYEPAATSQLKVAVASDDAGAEIMGLSLNVGDSVLEALGANTTIGWVFPGTTEEALEGVKNSDYYAALIIPENFTQEMLGFLDGEVDHPTIYYYENEKKNGIAPKITGKAKNAVQEQVRALTERLCGEESEVCAFFRGSRRLVLLLRGETEEAVRETAYEFCQNLRHELCQVLGWNALCAIGAPVSRVSALPESYRTAKDTLLQASACADNGVFGSTDFAGVQHEFDFSVGGSLADKLRHAAPEDVPRIVEGYFGDSAAQDMQSVLYRYYLLMNLLVTASQLADEVQAGSIPPPEDPQAVLGQAATLEGTKACAAEVLGRMTRLCYRHQNVRYSAEISRAKEFIRENYADSGISLHMVAAEVGFSPNHFSTVFSQETGQTFVEYLTAVRIEAAKHLLTEGNSRMSDIAFDVGYQDSHYFSYLFKKHVGVSPREYRSRSEEG